MKKTEQEKTDLRIIRKLDFALSMLLGTEKVDRIYECKNHREIKDYLLALK